MGKGLTCPRFLEAGVTQVTDSGMAQKGVREVGEGRRHDDFDSYSEGDHKPLRDHEQGCSIRRAHRGVSAVAQWVKNLTAAA